MTMKQFSDEVRAAIEDGSFEEMTPAERAKIMHQCLDLIESQHESILKYTADLQRLEGMVAMLKKPPKMGTA